MAKRKRLTPVEITTLVPDTAGASETKSMGPYPFGVQPVATRRPPIAQVAGDAAAQAALEEVAGELHTARAEGRMVLELPLTAVDETYLVRDRMMADEEELNVLMESLRVRGQQTPVEVVELGQGHYGLISGWRRLTALRLLHELDGQAGHGAVQALLRRPEAASDAYLAMVEENEIRVGLSYYERARIAARAAEQGVYPDQKAALKGLFASVSRSKRSKIGSFVRLYAALDDRLRFPSAISERLGLALVKTFDDDPGQLKKLRERLRKVSPDRGSVEVTILERAVRDAEKSSLTSTLESNSGLKKNLNDDHPIRLDKSRNRIVLKGRGVTADFVSDLEIWLAGRM